jgi:uncharacterized FlaG/YvyC family protein
MEAKEIKEKLTPSIALESNPAPKRSKRSETEKPEAKSAEKIPETNEETIRKLTENINQVLKSMSFSLQFVPGREGGQVIIKVLDGDGNLIRQIPPEAVTTLSSNVGDGVGLLLNGKL